MKCKCDPVHMFVDIEAAVDNSDGEGDEEDAIDGITTRSVDRSLTVTIY
jgi:hypothetical protein